MESVGQINRNCIFCGISLDGMCQPHKRKYCSTTCSNKYRLRQKKPGVQAKLWQHEPAVFEGAMEMYWAGMSSASIARYYDIPVGTMYSWVHDFGWQKERVEQIAQYKEKPNRLLTLKESFRIAGSAEEWQDILHDNAIQSMDAYENESIKLVCGRLHGYSAGKCAAVVYEKLKEDPCSGKTYAFCNKCGNAITTISWNEPIYHIERYVKTHGTFIWPDEKLGKSIEVSRVEFEHLISLQKYRKSIKKP